MSDHFSGCGTATAHFPYSDSVKEGHMVYFESGGYMTIIVMDDSAGDNESGFDLTLSKQGASNVRDTIRRLLQ